MKVLQVIDSLAMGGAEKLLLDSIPLYVKKGIKMDIAVLTDHNYPFMQELEKEKVCNIYKLSNKSVYNPFLIFKLSKLFKQYDIVHVHLFPALYWVAIAKVILHKNVKLIFTEHNTTNRRVKNKILSLIDKMIYKSYEKVIAISDSVYNFLCEEVKLPLKQIEIIYNGINIEKYKDAVSLNKADFFKKESIIIIQVSSFTPQKDQKTLIKSLCHLPNNYCLLLVGEGNLKNECEKLVKKLNLSERVLFLGRRIDVPELLKTADIVVLSSYYEGLSLSSIEGMSSYHPFIASDVPGLKEIVEKNGILFPQGDDFRLATEILKFEDPNYKEKITKQCIKRAEEFNINKMVDDYIKIYNQLINKDSKL